MDNKQNTQEGMPRRELLKLSAAGALALAVAPFPAQATPEGALEAIEKIIGEKAPKTGKIKLILPQIAEDGGTVPLTVSVDHAMKPDDYVKAVHIFTDGNPQPEVANYFFGPHNGKAQVSIRLRLIRTQKVIALAEMSNGDVYIERRQIKVTIGGCGG